MSYVDLIIRYLSGDLGPEESRAFEKELESDAGLREAYEEQAAAFRLIRDQLQERDREAFRDKLTEAMRNDVPPLVSGKSRRRLWYLPPAIACCLALLIIVFMGKPGNERVLARYHHPEKDPLLSAYNQDTRGETEAGIAQYHLGNYEKAREILSMRISEEPDNKMIQLFYLLSSMELDLQEKALELIGPLPSSRPELLDQSIGWYAALALLKTGRQEEALHMLQPLTDQEGPYRREARRLEKVLLK